MTTTIKRVATVCLGFGPGLLVLRRSEKVRTCQGLWACVSGSVERGETPLQCAFRELREETSIADATLVRPGRPFRVEVPSRSVVEVWPFLFFRGGASAESAVRIDFEHTEFRVLQRRSEDSIVQDLLRMETVPRLAETFARVDVDAESAAALAAISQNRADGAAEIAIAAALGFARCIARLSPARAAVFVSPAACVQAHAFHFASARPSMGSVAVAVARVADRALSASSSSSWKDVQEAVQAAATAVIADIRAAGDIIAQAFASSVLDGGNIALVTLSRSGTVAKALQRCFSAAPLQIHLFVAESRMANEGVALAQSVASGTAVTVFPDCASAALLSTLVQEGNSKVVVVVGADAVFGDESFVNKVGTRLLAMAAKELASAVRFCVLADTSKLRPEHSPPGELPWTVSELDTESSAFGSNLTSWCPVFELVPVSSAPSMLEFFTEHGQTSPAQIRAFSEATATLLSKVLDPSD